jgi:hypothetical protein
MMLSPRFSVVLSVSICVISPAAWAYSGGSGSLASPYQIAGPGDWQTLTATSADWARHFILTADIDLLGVTLTPIGNYSMRFTGSLNGNGHTIRNATISMPSGSYVGLFGCLGTASQVTNLGVENASITGQWFAGALAGLCDGGSVTSCYATGSVSGEGYLGGLLGLKMSGSMTSCYATCSVNGTSSSVGGLVGYNNAGPMTACFATGTVTSTSWPVGGLAGVNYGTMTACFATGSASGSTNVGGLAGENYGPMTECYALGSVTGTMNSIGGLVGRLDGSVTNCYAAGPVDGPILNKIGGFAGMHNSGTITSCFYDISANDGLWGVGGGSADGVTSKTTAEMKTRSTFTAAGWNFVNMWGIIDYQSYPYLKQLAVCHVADFDCDGIVDFADFAVMAGHWLQ